jgi:hypothetical protein
VPVYEDLNVGRRHSRLPGRGPDQPTNQAIDDPPVCCSSIDAENLSELTRADQDFTHDERTHQRYPAAPDAWADPGC